MARVRAATTQAATGEPPAEEVAMKILAAIMGTAVVLSLGVHANAQFVGPKVASARLGVRVIATGAIREPLNAVLKQAERSCFIG
jgi:hypothetical protein